MSASRNEVSSAAGSEIVKNPSFVCPIANRAAYAPAHVASARWQVECPERPPYNRRRPGIVRMNSSFTRIRRGSVILAIVFVAAVCGYRALGWGWLEAVYIVVITLATVGYGEHSQLLPQSPVFTVVVTISAVSADAYPF